MKPLVQSALLMRVRAHLAKHDRIVRSARNGGGVIVIDGTASKLYASLEALGRELNLIHDYEYLVAEPTRGVKGHAAA